MQAIILAAGMGKRLKELTRNNTKCMVKVNGVTLIDRMLHQIEKQHLSRIVIVTGYEGKKLIEYIETLGIQTPIVYVDNPIYDRTNNIYSLALAKEYLCQEDTLLFESDLIFEDAVLDALINDPRETLALVDKYESWILESNPHLYVMKSISKSYGVPGLRLGVLASGDTKTIALMKKDVAIWNINSFGEFYMQIEEKYKKDYVSALVKIREERKRFESKLDNISGVRVIPSQANFIMIELEECISPKELLKTLLVKHEILIKELTTKTNGRSYLRLAVRNTEDNDTLLGALKAELGSHN